MILLTAVQDWRPIRIGLVTAIGVLVPSLLALIPLWGALGAALASTLAMAAELAIRARASARHLDMRGRDHLRRTLPLVIALAVAIASGWLTGRLLGTSWGAQALVLVVGLAAAALTLFLVEGRSASTELRYLRDVIRRRS